MDLSTLRIDLVDYVDGTDIQDYIIPSSFNLQSRCDEAFATGSCTAWFKGYQFKYNIPPYSIMRIDSGSGDDYKQEYYCCSSTCTQYPTEENTYVHNISITEAASILCCFIVGTKYFSTTGTNTVDSDKVTILCDLMNQKYGYTFSLGSGCDSLDEEIEYSFGAGSTLYDCLNEIAKHYNMRVKVTSITTANVITIDFIDIDSNVSYSSDRIISATYSQNSDAYGKYLESEASNVVDRTTLVHAKNLTCKGDEIVLTADNAHLEAPTPIDTVYDFGIQGLKRRINFVIHPGTFYKYDDSGNVVQLTSANDLESFTIGDIYDINSSTLGQAYSSELCKYWSLDTFKTKKVVFTSASYYPTTEDAEKYAGFRTDLNGTTLDSDYASCNYSLNDRILPKSKWDLLTEQEQANTCFYTNNSRTIDNLYCNYKNNIISQVLNHAGGPMLKADFPAESYSPSTLLTVSFEADSTHSNAPTDYVFYLDYYAISNPFLMDEKTSVRIDDAEYQNFSKSYSNASSLIDFDKVSTNMNVSNESQGREELQLEIDTTGADIPSARSHLTYDNITWYISSAVTKFAFEHIVTTVNLVRNYNKVADCIGVDTQYNETKNPLNMIVTRPIYLGEGTSGEVTYNASHAYYMKLVFTFHNKRTETYYMPVVVLESDKERIFYCETDDQYSLMTRRGNETETTWQQMWHPWSDTSSWYLLYNKYVDGNNECESVQASIVKFINTLLKDGSVSSSMAEKLPVYTGSEDYVKTVYTTEKQLIYKDARERLTFTMKVKLNN